MQVTDANPGLLGTDLGQRSELVSHGGDPARVEREPVHECTGQAVGLGCLHVPGIGGSHLSRALAQPRSDRAQGLVQPFGGHLPELPGRRARGLACRGNRGGSLLPGRCRVGVLSGGLTRVGGG